jgi:hypothetical protein
MTLAWTMRACLPAGHFDWLTDEHVITVRKFRINSWILLEPFKEKICLSTKV